MTPEECGGYQPPFFYAFVSMLILVVGLLGILIWQRWRRRRK